jgi:iron complex outermembrane receptor protein
MNHPNVSSSFPLRYVAAGILLASGVPAVAAQEPLLGPIRITGQAVVDDRRPTVLEIDRDALNAMQSTTSDAASLLKTLPGVTVNGAGGVSSLPSIRGLADDRLRIKLDGMDLIATCPNHMNPPLSYVDPSNIGSLKVFAGITPVSVGGDSIGGTIIAETVAPKFAAAGGGPIVEGELGAFYRSNNGAYGGNATAGFANEDVALNYSGAWSRAGNYIAGGDFKTTTATGRPGHTLALDEVGSTAYETQNHTLGVAAKVGNGLLEAKLGYQNMPEQLYPNQRMDLLDNEQTRFSLGWSNTLDWGRIEARGYYETVDHFMDFGPDKRFWYGPNSQPPIAAEVGTACAPIGFMTCASGMPMYSESGTLGLSLQAEYALGDEDLLRLGTEYQRYRLDDYWTASGGGMWPGTFENISDGERDRVAFFTEWESRIDPAWLALLGIRYERVATDAGAVRGYKTDAPAPGNQIADAAAFNAADRSRTDHNIDLTALGRYTHDRYLDIEFGAARKVRSPNLYERYTWSTWTMAAVMNNFVGDGNGYIGDVGLEPETAHTVSATFDWHAEDRRWEIKATPYYTRVSDYIDAVAGPSGWTDDQFNVLQYANQSARLYGLDLSARMTLANNDWGHWALQAVISYTDGKNRDTGDELYNIMPLNGRFTVAQELAGWENSLEWELVDAKDEVADLRNEIATPGYGLVHLRASHEWKDVRIDFGIENLFDKLYYLPTGGTYTGQGSTMSINGIPWGIGVPGMGRSVYAGIKMTF